VGSGSLLATGFFVGVVPRSVLLGVLLFALGAILLAVRGYPNTGDEKEDKQTMTERQVPCPRCRQENPPRNR
jgi:hypothetical protein